MTRFEKWSVWITSALTAVSGVGYFWTKDVMRSEDPLAVISSPLEAWFLRIHVLVAPLLVFAVGAITVRHVWRHFRAGIPRGRRSGITTALVAGPMFVTGYLIQVITGETWLKAMALAHITASFVYVSALVLHQLFVRSGPKPQHKRRTAGAVDAPPKRRRTAMRRSPKVGGGRSPAPEGAGGS